MNLRKFSHIVRPLAVGALGAAALWGGAAEAQLISGPTNNAPWGRFDASVIGGNQPGVQTGSAQVGGFVSLFDDPDKIFFLDGSSNNNLNSGNWSADIGLGSRFVHQGSGAVLGGNAFYNYRNAETVAGNHGFQTVGFGVEALLDQWAFRSNAAFNVGSTQANGLVQGVGTPSYVDQMGGPMGVQNILLSGLQSNFTSALNTVDMNVSRKLDIANAELGAGVYYLSANHGPNSWGVNGTAEAWLTDSLATNITVSHDNLFDTTVFGGVSMYFGGPRIDADARRESSTSRLWARVQRRRGIPVANYNLPTTDLLATDPDTGDLITVLPVSEMDDLVAAPAVGTDIILVDAGATFTGLAPIVLNEGQRLLSASVTHQVDTAEIGSIQLPETNLGGITTIDMSTGNAVVIADNTEVSGFTISNAVFAGIYGSAVTGFNINRNVLNGGTYGVALDFTNSGTLSDNTAHNNTAYGYFIGTLAGGTVSGNTAHDNSFGFNIQTIDSGTVNDNSSYDNAAHGFFINTMDGGTLSNNTAYGNVDNGFLINTINGGTVSDNTAHDNTDGFDIGTLIGGTVSGNTAYMNGTGFRINTHSGGTVSDNTAYSNTFDGFIIETINGGTVSDNTAYMNGTSGINIGFLSGGTVSGNTSYDNLTGVRIINLDGGTLSNNTVYGNANNGFDISNFSGGTVSGNTAHDNTSIGFAINNFSGGTMSSNTSHDNLQDGFQVTFSGGNTATFTLNDAFDNAVQGYDITGTPATGVGTNTGTGNGSDDTF